MRARKPWLFVTALMGSVVLGWIMTASSIGQPKLMGFGDGTGMLDMRMFYTVPEAKTMLTSLCAEGVGVYTLIECIDYGFILCLAYVMSQVFQFLTNKLGSPEKLRRLHWLSYSRGLFDVVENTAILMSMHLLPAHDLVLGGAMIATMLKWLSLFLYLAAVLFAVMDRICFQRKQQE